MEKLITRKNLLILNSVLTVLFLVTVFFGLVKPLLGGGSGPEVTELDVTSGAGSDTRLAQLERSEYEIVTGNNLFTDKGPPPEVKVTKKNYYDLTKVWKLQGTLDYSDGFLAMILDKGEPDTAAKKPYTVHEVKEGEHIIRDQRPRIYDVEILEVRKNYVKYYRHDMDDKTEDERTFELTPW